MLISVNISGEIQRDTWKCAFGTNKHGAGEPFQHQSEGEERLVARPERQMKVM